MKSEAAMKALNKVVSKMIIIKKMITLNKIPNNSKPKTLKPWTHRLNMTSKDPHLKYQKTPRKNKKMGKNAYVIAKKLNVSNSTVTVSERVNHAGLLASVIPAITLKNTRRKEVKLGAF
jgi:hypothetical protein